MSKNNILKRIIGWALLVVIGAVYAITTVKRAEMGFFTSAKWIIWNSIFWLMFFGLFTAMVVSEVVGFVKKQKR